MKVKYFTLVYIYTRVRNNIHVQYGLDTVPTLAQKFNIIGDLVQGQRDNVRFGNVQSPRQITIADNCISYGCNNCYPCFLHINGLYQNTQILLPFVKYMYLSQKAYESLPCL